MIVSCVLALLSSVAPTTPLIAEPLIEPWDTRRVLQAPRFEVLLEGSLLGGIAQRGVDVQYSPLLRAGLGAISRSQVFALSAFATWEASATSARVLGLRLSMGWPVPALGGHVGFNVDLLGWVGAYIGVSFGSLGLELQGSRLNTPDPALLFSFKVIFGLIQLVERFAGSR
ncbi:MAG: hypothetical protein Q8K32_07035 [Archangium sp.]|nr:hypothetical protein [Archangium sp.]